MSGARFGQRFYGRPLRRELDLDALATITDDEAEAGEDVGLEGNHLYRDIRFVEWDFVAAALQAEAALFDRFKAALDIDLEHEVWREELEAADTPEEDFWGLDLGVISAVVALSAMGAVTVRSCNAGGFGGRHAEAFPLVTMFLPRMIAAEVFAVAEAADVGLEMIEGGLVRMYGRTDFDLHRFARIALARYLKPDPVPLG